MEQLTLMKMIENEKGELIERMYNFPFEACKSALEFSSDKEAKVYYNIEYIHEDVDIIRQYCHSNNIGYTKLF